MVYLHLGSWDSGVDQTSIAFSSLSSLSLSLSLSPSLHQEGLDNSISIPNFMGFHSSTTSYHPSPPRLSLRKHRFHFSFSQNLSPFSLSINPTTRSSSSNTNASSLTLNLIRPNNFLFLRNSPKLSHKFMIGSSSQEIPSISSSNNRDVIIFRSLITVSLAVANRVLYKLALVPMKQYPFFLAQFTTFGYVAIYFSILYSRYQLGIVTKEMLGLPKLRFVTIGMLEALGVATGMSAGATLPGPAIPILSQTFLVWQLTFSSLLLGRKYSINQIFGCLLVAAGVVVAVASGPNSGHMAFGTEFVWPAVMIASSAFQAAASIVKESVFLDAARRLKGKSVDIFVVNSFGSGFQALFVLLFLPLLSNIRGIPFAQLPLYLKDGAGCFLNIGATGCDGSPWLPLMYVTTNILFNISLLNLVKISSAVVASLAVTLSVPMSIYVLSLPLPYLPEGTSLSPFFVFGSIILVLGLGVYNLSNPARQASKTA